MAAFATAEMVSATDASRKLSSVLNAVASGERKKIGILRNNKVDAVVISAAEYDRFLAALEIAEDLEIARIVEERSKTPLSDYVPFEKVFPELAK